ncbi:tRNA-splicing endonuclease subunit Sen34 [Armigeres subalbatus]|uniref:tRNA-splicing endonuclease subunit Sen34 n=1 Tax=Armigeres subalbatus TaxID=124917 RepID=UPI002ED11199
MVSKIPVTFQHNRGFVYDAEDYLKLRSTHRIVGNLIGTPVSKPRSATSYGLPAVLTPLEIQLGLDEGLIELIDKNTVLTSCPSEVAKQQFASLIQQQINEQKQPIVEKRMAEFKRLLPTIIEGKRKKLLKSGIKEADLSIDADTLVKEEVSKLETMEFEKLVQIPHEYPLSAEYTHHEYDLPKHEHHKYKIFKDIWRTRPVFITGGDSFGCDFLLYPGDPLYYHASHMVHILTDEAQRLDVKYLIRCCRLSVVVNKVCVFAFEGPNGDISYQTMEWEGNVPEPIEIGAKT